MWRASAHSPRAAVAIARRPPPRVLRRHCAGVWRVAGRGWQVSKQLAAAAPGSGGGTSIDQQFKALEAQGAVEDELAAMKAAQGILPASPVDDELAQLKASLDAEKKPGDKL